MRKPKRLVRNNNLLFLSGVCLILLSQFSSLSAHDLFGDLSPDSEGFWMCLVLQRENNLKGDEVYGQEELELESRWACPHCGTRDNIGLVGRCRTCAYSSHNPDGYLFRPVDTGIITNEYSHYHKAIDIGARRGSLVFAAEDGIVIENTKDKWAGNVLKIRHNGGLQTAYGHLQESLVPTFRHVKMGEAIARVGSTGASTGPHLHFEVHIDGEAGNPALYLSR